MAKARALGHLQHLTINIDAPIKMKAMKMDFKSIMVMVGQNRTGKTLVLKINWAMAMIPCLYLALRKNDNVSTDVLAPLAQELFDGTFEDQDFNGELGAQFKNGRIQVNLDKGRVTKVYVDLDKVDTASPPIYMSTTMRLFSQIKTYLQTEKLVGHDDNRLMEFYRLYDIVFVRMLKEKIGGGKDIPENILGALKNFDLDRYDWKSVRIDDKSVYVTDGAGKERDLATFSNGEQAMFNMMLAHGLQ